MFLLSQYFLSHVQAIVVRQIIFKPLNTCSDLGLPKLGLSGSYNETLDDLSLPQVIPSDDLLHSRMPST